MVTYETPNTNIWRTSFLITAALLVVLFIGEIYFRIIPGYIENVGPGLLSPIRSTSHQTSGQDNTIGSVFRKIDVLEDMGAAGDEAWSSLLLPQGGGYILARPEDPSATEAEPWGVTMFHSLHCLGILRNAIQEQNGLRTGEGRDHSRNHTKRGGDGDESHTAHCLSYIAQALTCCGDGTLEKATHFDDPDGHFAIDGQGVWHQCRDTSLLWDVAMKSTREPVNRWASKQGDTVYSVWGKETRTN